MKILCVVVGAILALFTQAAIAEYPDHAIRLIVPYSAGGAADTQARLVAAGLGARLGQPIVVENHPGASGTIGAAFVAHASADGYTLLYDATAFAVNPTLYKSLPYDSKRDLRPISLISLTPNLLVVRADSPYHGIADLTVAARSKPGRMTFGSSGQGTAQHVAAALFAQGFGLKLVHVPYKGGAPALADLMGGQIDMMFSNMSASYPLVRGGKLRALAVSSKNRVPELPDVPTVAESGLPGYEVYEWNGMFAPSGVPDEIARKVETAVQATLQDPSVRSRLTALGAQPIGSSAQEFGKFVDHEMSRAKQILNESGIKSE